MTFVYGISYINLGLLKSLVGRVLNLHLKFGGRFFSPLCILSYIKFIRCDIFYSLSNGQESHCFHWRKQMNTRKKKSQSQLHIHIHFSTSSSLLLVCTQQCSWLGGPPLLAGAADWLMSAGLPCGFVLWLVGPLQHCSSGLWLPLFCSQTGTSECLFIELWKIFGDVNVSELLSRYYINHLSCA